MYITFLIGNGFDISMGMKSKYINFYPYFMNNGRNDNIIRKNIENNYENWADLELSLGDLTNHIDESEYEQFINDKIEMDKLLIDYLKHEQEKIEFNEVDITRKFKHAIDQLTKGNNEKENNMINDIFKIFSAQNYYYHAINFNYTGIFDKYFEICKNLDCVNKHIHSNTEIKDFLGNIIHIHGSLIDNEVLLGLNDISQINPNMINSSSMVKH